MIMEGKIIRVINKSGIFFIEPIMRVVVGEIRNRERPYNLTKEEALALYRWGFYYLYNSTITIYRKRQIDMLESDFRADVTHLRSATNVLEKLMLDYFENVGFSYDHNLSIAPRDTFASRLLAVVKAKIVKKY